jgi:anti-anti-sigma regulatory factor/putative methionine-R-sulfoxide reductase with GAF domain
VAALSERFTRILDVEQLLNELVNRVKEDFDYYYAHIYLVDEQHQNLVMTAGVGEAGAEMKASGHSIPVDAVTSLVARAARTGEVVSVENVREVEDWLPNPLLPDTHCEMAVPIMQEEQVVGVLDVQEDEIGGLAEDDANLLRSLAGHVAVALANAQLFADVQEKLETIEAQQQTIQDISTPVIPVLDTAQGGIIVMPVVGAIDSMRARDITRSLLAGVSRHKAKIVILDVTGVSLMDTGIVNYLNKSIQAARLKGAQTIVTGISDAVAESIVDLGIDWSDITTLSDLQNGLRVALQNVGLKLGQA